MSESPTNDIRIGEISSRWALGSNLSVDYRPSIASTNDLAKEEAFGPATEHALRVYLADHQTKGRGRGANTWTDAEPGASLLSSWSFEVGSAPQPWQTARTGLALYRAALATWPSLDWSLKAPNDLFLNGKKVAGLLLETVSQGDEFRLIVGLGMNVFESPEAIPEATSLLENLPEGVPLLGQDWLGFLDRWLFELMTAVGVGEEQLDSSETTNLMSAMNRRLKGADQVTLVDADGSFETGRGRRSWMDI